MNLLNIVLPIIVIILSGLILIIFIPLISFLSGEILCVYIFHNKDGSNAQYRLGINKRWFKNILGLVSLILLSLVSIGIFNLLSSWWLKPQSNPNFRNEFTGKYAIVAFGFGLGQCEGKTPTAGKSNSHLFNWISDNTHPSVIVAQHGIILASQSYNNNFNLIEMHPLGKGYVDTYEAVEFSLKKIDSLYNKRLINTNVLVVAHDMQMQRVLWDIHKISVKNPEWQKFKFIAPEIPKSPFSQKSTQLHTKWRFIYNLVEICYSRPRDYWFK